MLRQKILIKRRKYEAKRTLESAGIMNIALYCKLEDIR